MGIDQKKGVAISLAISFGFTARTEFEGLFLCGASTLSHGVAGVTASGIEAAKAVLGLDRLELANCRTRDLLRGKGEARLLRAEEVTDARMEGRDGEV